MANNKTSNHKMHSSSDAWSLTETQFLENKRHYHETLFSLGNGYLGVRGNFEEGVPDTAPSTRGTYINGFYDETPIHYGETYTGYPKYNQTMLNITDSQTIELFLEDEPFSLFNGKILDYQRTLDFKKGLMTRTLIWQSPKKKEVKITIIRLVSFSIKELFLIDYIVESINFSGKIRCYSSIKNPRPNTAADVDIRKGLGDITLKLIDSGELDPITYLQSKTQRSDLTLVCSTAHITPSTGDEATIQPIEEGYMHCYEARLAPKQSYQLRKFSIYTNSRYHSNPLEDNIALMKTVLQTQMVQFYRAQADYLTPFWEQALTKIVDRSQPRLQQIINFNLFQLLQSVGRDNINQLSAKGLSGNGYDGHYFWDTEIYALPVFIFLAPELAKHLILFRYHTLPEARERAREMGYSQGALFAWRTINGKECSGYYPAGTAQIHINPDIAYALMLYYDVTQDIDFMANEGAELLFEMARFMWIRGNYRDDGLFGLYTVTGPDEYTCLVNNNYYTNVMTKQLFLNCRRIWDILASQAPKRLHDLCQKINCSEKEILEFEKAGQAMFLPYDASRALHGQDDSFLDKPRWNFKDTPQSNYPLLLHYHPLTLYQYQVCKQGDVILAHFLCEDETTADQIKRDYDYYETITTHDSSLSACVFSIMAAKVGQHEVAYRYFLDTLFLDIDNLHHNTDYGLHVACMAGSWLTLAFGFAGLRVKQGTLSLTPHLPNTISHLELTLFFQSRRLRIILDKDHTLVTVIQGEPLTLVINGKSVLADKA